MDVLILLKQELLLTQLTSYSERFRSYWRL